MTEQEARAAVEQARALLGKGYKAAIRNAWLSGNYRREGLDVGDLAASLQRVRNNFGPSWLEDFRPS